MLHSFLCTVFSSVRHFIGRACFQIMAHADWLLRGSGKKRIALSGAVRGHYAFVRTGKFWRGNF